jgi:hypothetical protein
MSRNKIFVIILKLITDSCNKSLQKYKQTMSIYLSIYGSTVLCWTLAVFQFLILYTVSRTPWTGVQAIGRPLPTHRMPQNTE